MFEKKLIGLKNCWSGNTPEAPSQPIRKGEPITSYNKAQYNELIRGLYAMPAELLEQEPIECEALVSGTIYDPEHGTFVLKRGETLHLSAAVYCAAAVFSKVKPVSSDVWSPDFVHDDGEIKKFYDEAEVEAAAVSTPEKSWISKWRSSRSGK